MRSALHTFSHQTVLVTGAASGIGLACAHQLAELGADLILMDINLEALGNATVEIEGDGGTVLWSDALDIADEAEVARAAREVSALVGAVDAVIHCAGTSTWGTVDNLRHFDWKSMVDINLMGTIHVVEHFVPPMVRRGKPGAVVLVSSAAGLLGLPWHAAYSAAKFGVRGIGEVLRFDLERHGITVHVVCPGAVDTQLVRTVNVVGVDREDPRVQKLSADFRKHAVSPEHAASVILAAITKGTYLVFTSRDIELAYLAQRVCPPLYRLAMRRLSRRVFGVADTVDRDAASTPPREAADEVAGGS